MPGTMARAASHNDDKIYGRTLDWDKWNAAFLGKLAVLWGKKLDVIVQTLVRTVFPTAELKTPGSTVENLTIDPPLLDRGQGKIEECNGEPRTNVTDLEAPRDTRNTIAGGKEVINTPFALTSQRNEIELQGSIPEPISTPFVAKPDWNTNNMKNWK